MAWPSLICFLKSLAVSQECKKEALAGLGVEGCSFRGPASRSREALRVLGVVSVTLTAPTLENAGRG